MQLPVYTTRYVFLTGATGVLGAQILKELLQATDAEIFCLVRAPDIEMARQRLADFLHVYDPEGNLDAEFQARVTPVLGEITEPNLGLSEKDYNTLAECIDVTIHGAASTNLFARFAKMEPINIGGTRQVIDFCMRTAAKRLCYVSTFTVMGDKTFDSSVVFREEDFDIGQGFDHMSYQQSKFIAEGLVRESEGLAWKIVRPGQIFGESATGNYPQGQTNVSGLFYDIFKTIIETGVALYSDSQFDVVPVDYVAKATVFLALSEPSIHSTFHLTNPDVKSYTQVTRMLSDLGYPIEVVDQEEYKRLLFERQLIVNGAEYKSYTTQAFKWWYRREGFDFRKSCRTATAATQAVLEPRGIYCPKLDWNLLGTYIDFGLKRGYFPPETQAPMRAASR